MSGAQIPPELRAEVEKYIALESLLLQINGRNSRQVTLDVQSSIYTNRADLLPYLVNLILTVVHVRPYNVALYAKLVRQLIGDNAAQRGAIADLMPTLIRSIIHFLSADSPFPQHTAIVHFLYRLMSQKVLSFRDFCAISRLSHPGSTLSPLAKKWIFCMFAPELEDAKPEFFRQMLELIDVKDDNRFCASVFIQFAGEFEKLSVNDWSLHKIRRQGEFDCDSLPSIIEHDQVSHLSYQSQSSHFDPNERVEPSVVLRSHVVQYRPTLLQFAAFCGATRCFKLLLSRGADPALPDDSGHFLTD
jgi:hypothetical protein